MKKQLKVENVVINGTTEEEFVINLAAANVAITRMDIESNKLEDIIEEAMKLKERYPFLAITTYTAAITQLISIKNNMFNMPSKADKPLHILSTDPILETVLGMIRTNHEIYIEAVNLFNGGYDEDYTRIPKPTKV